MKTYPVEGVSIFFSTEPQREFTVRFFTVMYFLPLGKIITKNYFHNSTNLRRSLKVPISITMDDQFMNSVPTGIPTNYGGHLRLLL